MSDNMFRENEELYEQLVELQYSWISFWKEYTLYTPQWWIGIALAILPWIWWVRWSEKKSRNRLLHSGFIVIIISSFLDLVGVRLGLWYYHYEIIPLSPAFLPWDFTLIPISVMALIEYKPHLSPVLKALIFAFLSSFIGGTIFEYFDYYVKVHWSAFYSFPIYFVIFLIAIWISRRENFNPV